MLDSSKNRNSLQFTLSTIAERLHGELSGPPDRVVKGICPITRAGPEQITFLDDPKYFSQARDSKAAAVVIAREAPSLEGVATIRVDQPHWALARLLELFCPRERKNVGISPDAHIGDGVEVGEDANIYPGAFIGDRVRVGEGTDIFPGVFIGDDVTVGSECILYPNVSVYDRCRIGDRVILHAGSVIGADGFGYVQVKDEKNPKEPVIHYKIPQVGTVVIEDDVEIGANTTIDRAALEETRIGKGTKIDNLVMVAHNCRVGSHAILISQVGVSGSTQIGNYVTIAGQAGLVGHITIGDGATVGAQSGVTKSIPPGKKVIGSPAIEGRKALLAYRLLESLPEYRHKIEELDRRLKKLEGQEGADKAGSS